MIYELYCLLCDARIGESPYPHMMVCTSCTTDLTQFKLSRDYYSISSRKDYIEYVQTIQLEMQDLRQATETE